MRVASASAGLIGPLEPEREWCGIFMRPIGAATNGVATQEPRPWMAACRWGSVVDLSVAWREVTSTPEARGSTTCWPRAESVDARVRKMIPGTFIATIPPPTRQIRKHFRCGPQRPIYLSALDTLG